MNEYYKQLPKRILNSYSDSVSAAVGTLKDEQQLNVGETIEKNLAYNVWNRATV